MSTMRRMMLILAIAALSSPCAPAQDTPEGHAPQGTRPFEAVSEEYQAAVKSWLTEYRAARDEAKRNGEEKGFKFDKPHPGTLFSPQFLAIAEKNPEAPEAIDALKMTLQTSGGPKPGTALETRAKAVRILKDYHVAKPSIRRLLRLLTQYDDRDSQALVDEVIARNPDRKIQMAAYKGQVAHREMLIKFAELLEDPKQLETIANANGETFVKSRLAGAEKARGELDSLKASLRNKYADLSNDLSIGRAAPEINIQAVDGKEATLSALKGKVVVLDIWATWCGPCKAMIPHEREMVARFKDKPFALVSISADEKKETLTAFLATEKMPWTHWWNGQEGGIMDDWDVKYFPTIYVLDGQGVIRHKDLRGEELEKAVDQLLAEQAVAPAAK